MTLTIRPASFPGDVGLEALVAQVCAGPGQHDAVAACLLEAVAGFSREATPDAEPDDEPAPPSHRHRH